MLIQQLYCSRASLTCPELLQYSGMATSQTRDLLIVIIPPYGYNEDTYYRYFYSTIINEADCTPHSSTCLCCRSTQVQKFRKKRHQTDNVSDKHQCRLLLFQQ